MIKLISDLKQKKGWINLISKTDFISNIFDKHLKLLQKFSSFNNYCMLLKFIKGEKNEASSIFLQNNQQYLILFLKFSKNQMMHDINDLKKDRAVDAINNDNHIWFKKFCIILIIEDDKLWRLTNWFLGNN